MRKHFLILMLMALLPLAGWAEEALSPETEGLEVAVANRGYGGADLDPANGDIRVTLNSSDIPSTYWEVEGYYETKDGAKKEHVANLSVGTTRYVKINFKGVYTGYAWGEFEVTKGVIVYTVKNDNYFTTTYRAALPDNNIAANDAVTATLNGVAIDANNLANYLTVGTITYTTNATTTSPVGNNYTLSFTGITLVDATNYELQPAEQKLTINAAAITAGNNTLFNFANNYTAAYTYTAAEQKPTVTITWNHDNDNSTTAVTLTEGTDFTVAYKVNNAVVASPTNVATYSAYITGIGNYTTAGEGGIAVEGLNFQIGKAPLTIRTISQTKVYDGQQFDPTTAQFSISGRVGADATKAVTGQTATIANSAANVANYNVTVNAANAKIGGTVDLSDNYEVTSNDVVIWKITKRPVTLTVDDAVMNVGSANFPTLPTATASKGYDEQTGDVVGETGAISAAEATAIVNAYTVKLLNGENETYATALANAANAAVGNYPDAYDATTNNAPANYTVKVVKGKLTVKGADFTIAPEVASDIEYGDSYTIGYYAGTATIDESQLVFVINGTEYPYVDRANWVLPTARGNYNVTIKAGTAVGTDGNLGGTATPQPTAYNIVKKNLTIVVKNQTVHKGDPISILQTLTAGTNGYTTLTGVKSGETITLNYSFANTVTKDANNKITNNAGDIENAILVALGDDEVSDNYQIPEDYTKGKLTVSTTFTADLAAATVVATITEAAANGSNYDVTISGRKLNADKWNVMVLPFAVKPLDFCNTVDQYAVFNTLKSAENGNVKFGLCYETIPANQPFLVKTKTEVDFDYLWDDDNNNATPKVKKYVFEGVKFVNAEPKQTDVAGAEFIGTFAGKTIEDDSFYAMQGGVFKHFTEEMELGFLRAYIVLTNATPGQEARFFVEEPGENGTTAIKELNIDTMKSVSVDGWYTLNGVKLQSIPTEKGVYINNGKKVVIK